MAADERGSIPVADGALAGIACWLLGYLLTYLGTVDSVRADARAAAAETVVGDGIDAQVVGWLFYNAHGVDVQFPGTVGFQFVAGGHNFVAADDGSLWLLFLLPAALLVLGGAAVAWRYPATLAARTDAAIVGATVTVGYLACSVLGLVVFGVGVGDETIRPDPIAATLLAGAAYPVVFGGIGGVVGSVTIPRDAGRTGVGGDRD